MRYPFSDLSNFKVRPGVVVSGSHSSEDLFIVAMTSKTSGLLAGEFILKDWAAAGLNVESAIKRGIFTIHRKLVIKSVGKLANRDAEILNHSLRDWMKL